MPTVKWRKSPKSQKAEKSGKSEAGKEQASDLSGISDEKKLPDWLKSLITQTVEAEAGRILGEQTFPKSQTVDKEPPPLPGKIKGAHDRPVAQGKRVKLAGTADAELVRLLDEWRRERGNVCSEQSHGTVAVLGQTGPEFPGGEKCQQKQKMTTPYAT